MNIQVLVATMHQTDHTLPGKMHITTDAIIANQCDRNCVEAYTENGNRFLFLNFAERGVGLNRNNALMRADGDICLFADDDMVYDDDYAETVKKAFAENPNADVIIFNLREKRSARYHIRRKVRVGYWNYLRYGTARVAVRLEKVRKCGIFFNQCFGGGTEHCHGEDNLFLHDCLRRGLKVIAVPMCIATLTDARESSWNRGYNEKYLLDQGALYRTISRRWWRLLCLQDAVRRSKSYKMRWDKAYRTMVTGAKNYGLK